jgi:hypothetical protein
MVSVPINISRMLTCRHFRFVLSRSLGIRVFYRCKLNERYSNREEVVS